MRLADRLSGAVAQGVRTLSTPLRLDDYTALVNPMWSREPRGRIVEVRPAGDGMTTVRIRPNVPLAPHRAGQYVRLGVELAGRRHWRAYTITSRPGDEHLAVTVKALDGGVVSPHLARHAKAGDLVHLGEAEGTFVLPGPRPERVLLVSAGAGVTPVAALLAELEGADVVHVALCRDELALGDRLHARAARDPRYRLHVHRSAAAGRLTPAALHELVPDWRERAAFACGPSPLLDDLREAWGDVPLAVERFQPLIGDGVAPGAGGTAELRLTGTTVACDGATPILRAGQAQGLRLPHGCEIGICRTCVGALVEGRVRDLRTGAVTEEPGTMVRTCVSCPEGGAVLDL